MPSEIQQISIYETIKHRIVHMIYQPHQRLTEIKLSEEFNCSRTPVREALRKLEQEGWVTTIPHQGYYIRSYSAKEINDLYELLITLEKMAVRLAIQHADADTLLRMKEEWGKKPVSWEETIGLQLLKEDAEFHEQIARIGGNDELLSHIRNINERRNIVRRIDLNRKDWAKSIIEDHVILVEAMLNKDVQAAEALIERHIRSGKELIDRLMQLYYQ